jgi:hypothetical protein
MPANHIQAVRDAVLSRGEEQAEGDECGHGEHPERELLALTAARARARDGLQRRTDGWEGEQESHEGAACQEADPERPVDVAQRPAGSRGGVDLGRHPARVEGDRRDDEVREEPAREDHQPGTTGDEARTEGEGCDGPGEVEGWVPERRPQLGGEDPGADVDRVVLDDPLGDGEGQALGQLLVTRQAEDRLALREEEDRHREQDAEQEHHRLAHSLAR